MSLQPVKPSSNFLRKAFCVLSADRLLSQGREPNGSTSTPLLWLSLTMPSRILGSFMQITRHSDVSDTRGTSLRNCLLDYLLKRLIDWSARRFSMQSHGKDLSRIIVGLEFASPARIFGWRTGSSGNCGQKPECGWGRLPRSPAGRKHKLIGERSGTNGMPDCLVSDLEFHDNHLVFEPFDVGMKLARRHLPIRLLVHCDCVPASCFTNHATSKVRSRRLCRIYGNGVEIEAVVIG